MSESSSSCSHFTVYVCWAFSTAFFKPGMLRKVQEWVWKGFGFSFCCLMCSELGFVLEYQPFPGSESAGGFPA